jgi:hypothetical protein
MIAEGGFAEGGGSWTGTNASVQRGHDVMESKWHMSAIANQPREAEAHAQHLTTHTAKMFLSPMRSGGGTSRKAGQCRCREEHERVRCAPRVPRKHYSTPRCTGEASPRRGVPCSPLRTTAVFAQRRHEADSAEPEREVLRPDTAGPAASAKPNTRLREPEGGLRRLAGPPSEADAEALHPAR